MAASYAVNNTGAVMYSRMRIVYDARRGVYNHTYNRSFMKFWILNPPFTLDEIDSVVLDVYCTSVSPTASVHLESAKTDATGWGGTLEATSGDWGSTQTNSEETKSISSTGHKEYSVNKNNLRLDGYTYFKLGIPSVSSLVQWATQNHGTASYRPILKITYTPVVGGGQHLFTLMGCGN